MTEDNSHVHRHMVLDTEEYVWHSHPHSCEGPLRDFNRLHHHPPVEHDGLSDEELRFNAGRL